MNDQAIAEATSLKSPELTHIAAKRFLKFLTNVDIRKVGLELGLHYHHLKNMPEETLLDDMLSCWLREDDHVSANSGTPSWESLAKALEEGGFTGVAENVRKGIAMFLCTLMPITISCSFVFSYKCGQVSCKYYVPMNL